MRSTRELGASELIYTKKLVSSSHFGLSMLLVAFILSCIVGPLLSWPKVSLSGVLVMFAAYCILFVPFFIFFIWWPFRYVGNDYNDGQKIIEKVLLAVCKKLAFSKCQLIVHSALWQVRSTTFGCQTRTAHRRIAAFASA